MILVAEGTEGFIKTVDYVSGQSATWMLTALLLILGSAVIYFMRRILKDSQEGRVELNRLNEKHIQVLEKSANLAADSAADVRAFGKQVQEQLDRSTRIIEGNTEALADIAVATKLQAKSSDEVATVLVDMKIQAERNASEARRISEESGSVIRRNTEALEGDERRKKAPGRPPR